MLNVRFGSLLGLRGLLLIYTCGEKTLFEKPRNPSPRLLGLACGAPARRLRVTSGAPTTLLFDLLRNYYCRNKPYKIYILKVRLKKYFFNKT